MKCTRACGVTTRLSGHGLTCLAINGCVASANHGLVRKFIVRVNGSCSRQRLLKPVVISSVAHQQRPRDACILVGQRYRSDIAVTPLNEAVQPALTNRLSMRSAECRSSSVDQERAQV